MPFLYFNFFIEKYTYIYIFFVILMASFRHMGQKDLHDKSKEREQRCTMPTDPPLNFY